MAVEAGEIVEKVLELLVGVDWPEGDEDKCEALGKAWEHAGGELAKVAGDLAAAVNKLNAANEGKGMEAFLRMWDKLSKGDKAFFPALEAASKALGGAADDTSDTIYATKIEFVTMATIQGAAILAQIAAAPITLGITAGTAAASTAALRFSFMQVLRRMLGRIEASMVRRLLKNVALEALSEVRDDIISQFIHMTWGSQDGYSIKQTALAAGGGAAGGLAAIGVNGLGKKVFGEGAELGVKGVTTSLASNVSAEVAGTVATGGPVNWETFASGGLGGATDHGASKLGDRVSNAFNTPGIDPPNLGGPNPGGDNRPVNGGNRIDSTLNPNGGNSGNGGGSNGAGGSNGNGSGNGGSNGNGNGNQQGGSSHNASGNSGNTGGNSGNSGGHSGGNEGNSGGNSGNSGGHTGNSGGNSGNSGGDTGGNSGGNSGGSPGGDHRPSHTPVATQSASAAAPPATDAPGGVTGHGNDVPRGVPSHDGGSAQSNTFVQAPPSGGQQPGGLPGAGGTPGAGNSPALGGSPSVTGSSGPSGGSPSVGGPASTGHAGGGVQTTSASASTAPTTSGSPSIGSPSSTTPSTSGPSTTTNVSPTNTAAATTAAASTTASTGAGTGTGSGTGSGTGATHNSGANNGTSGASNSAGTPTATRPAGGATPTTGSPTTSAPTTGNPSGATPSSTTSNSSTPNSSNPNSINSNSTTSNGTSPTTGTPNGTSPDANHIPGQRQDSPAGNTPDPATDPTGSGHDPTTGPTTDANQNVTPDTAPDTGHRPDPTTDPTSTPDARPDSSRDTHQDPNHDPSQDPGQDSNRDPDQGPNRDTNRDTNQVPSRDPNRDTSLDTESTVAGPTTDTASRTDQETTPSRDGGVGILHLAPAGNPTGSRHGTPINADPNGRIDNAVSGLRDRIRNLFSRGPNASPNPAPGTHPEPNPTYDSTPYANSPATTDPNPRPDRPDSPQNPDGPIADRPPLNDGRPLNEPGGLMPPSVRDQSVLNVAVPRDADGMPQVHPDPRTGHWFALQNDGGTQVPGRDTNCMDSVLAFGNTWFGRPEVAAARIPGENGGEVRAPERARQELGTNWTPLARRPDGSTDTAGAYGDIEARLRDAGPGAMTYVVTSRPTEPRVNPDGTIETGQVSHAWAAINVDGEVLWVDPQSGRVMSEPYPDQNRVWAIAVDANAQPIDMSLPPTSQPADPTPESAPQSNPPQQSPDSAPTAPEQHTGMPDPSADPTPDGHTDPDRDTDPTSDDPAGRPDPASHPTGDPTPTPARDGNGDTTVDATPQPGGPPTTTPPGAPVRPNQAGPFHDTIQRLGERTRGLLGRGPSVATAPNHTTPAAPPPHQPGPYQQNDNAPSPYNGTPYGNGPVANNPYAQPLPHHAPPTAPGSPIANRPPLSASRPFNQPGGLLPPNWSDAAALNNAVPRNPDGTPVVHPDPRLGRWFRLQNDGGLQVPGRNINCLDGVLAFGRTWFGRPEVSAARMPGENTGETNGMARAAQEANAPWSRLDVEPDGSNNPGAGFARLEAALRASGPGSISYIVTEWPPRNVVQPDGSVKVVHSSHAWAAVNVGGDILYVDPQTNQIATSPQPNATSVYAITLGPDAQPVSMSPPPVTQPVATPPPPPPLPHNQPQPPINPYNQQPVQTNPYNQQPVQPAPHNPPPPVQPNPYTQQQQQQPPYAQPAPHHQAPVQPGPYHQPPQDPGPYNQPAPHQQQPFQTGPVHPAPHNQQPFRTGPVHPAPHNPAPGDLPDNVTGPMPGSAPDPTGGITPGSSPNPTPATPTPPRHAQSNPPAPIDTTPPLPSPMRPNPRPLGEPATTASPTGDRPTTHDGRRDDIEREVEAFMATRPAAENFDPNAAANPTLAPNPNGTTPSNPNPPKPDDVRGGQSPYDLHATRDPSFMADRSNLTWDTHRGDAEFEMPQSARSDDPHPDTGAPPRTNLNRAKLLRMFDADGIDALVNHPNPEDLTSAERQARDEFDRLLRGDNGELLTGPDLDARRAELAARGRDMTGARRYPINSGYAGRIVHFASPTLDNHFPDGVYINLQGYPDFTAYAVRTINLPHTVIAPPERSDFPPGPDGTKKFKEARAEANDDQRKLDIRQGNAEFRNDPMWAGVRPGRTAPGYVWHHVEGTRTMMLIPFAVHYAVKHHGGIASAMAPDPSANGSTGTSNGNPGAQQ
ncbi:toxin glutamine deamidase domain-containing protein [Embleya sp. NPDC008237]|uniref:toxin glutamine deamidase domain-containing protein n=1 Tax=Embleya sp. NPDC008237 TaxID=3363978 RepID=UPI0036EAC4C8